MRIQQQNDRFRIIYNDGDTMNNVDGEYIKGGYGPLVLFGSKQAAQHMIDSIERPAIFTPSEWEDT